MKKGQITIYIIIGLILLLIVGLVLYFTTREAREEMQAAQPRLAELPAKIEPVRQAVQSCITRLGKDAIVRLGSQGGYVDDVQLKSNPVFSTEGNSVDYNSLAGPKVAYWWYMKSSNKCNEGCEFDSKRPPLKREDGGRNIEQQIDDYVNQNLPECVLTVQPPGCQVQQADDPFIQSHITEKSVYFDGKYKLTATCEDQTAIVDEYYISLDVNLGDMYDLATNITNFQIQYNMLEQATTTILGLYSGVDSNKLPPYRALEFSGPNPGEFWIKSDVKEKIKSYLTSHISLIQVFGARNYEPIVARPGVRDSDLYQLVYNKEFLLPLNKTYPNIDARFVYLPIWEPYLDLNCNGELCRADSGTNFFMIPFTVNRYEFAYDLSYPVLVELRDPYAFKGEGYVFQFFLEQNMRNSKPFKSNTVLPPATDFNTIPTLFCDPAQRTSGPVKLYVKSGDTFLGLNDVTVSYVCGDLNCNLGKTVNGTFESRFPRCINGQISLYKKKYSITTKTISTEDSSQNLSIVMEPIRTVNVRVKNYALLKATKYDDWKYLQARGLTRPKPYQETIIVLQKQLANDYETPYGTVAKVQGAQAAQMDIIPGKYNIQIISLLRENLSIPVDNRCTSYKNWYGEKEDECYDIPDKPIEFTETKPFPNGITQFEHEFTSQMLRGAQNIEFRQFTLGFEDLQPENRVVEDLGAIGQLEFYIQAQPDLLKPVIS